MNEYNFKLLIESIGFKRIKCKKIYYKYKEYKIYLSGDTYCLFTGTNYHFSCYDDLTLIGNHFKKEFISIKLKNILG